MSALDGFHLPTIWTMPGAYRGAKEALSVLGDKRMSLCLPCRNEGAHIREVVEQVPACVDEILVISNRSTDDTVDVAESIGGRVRVLVDDRCRDGVGYGFAHMTGIEHARGDIIAAADGDGTYPVERLEEMAGFLLERELDFVSCSRYPVHANTDISPALRCGVAMLNLEVRWLYGIRMNDILSGMWLFRENVRKKLGLTEGDWNLSPQIKLNAAQHPDIRFAELPIQQYARMGHTKQRYLRTGMSHARWIARNRLARKELLVG